MIQPRIAFSKGFMESYSKLPRAQQKKVREFAEKFQHDPTQTAINFEHLDEAKDEKVRSARLDQTYRVIVVHPPKGDVFLCVWVDHHDEAYRWARNKHFEINPKSGVFQLFEVEEGKATPDVTSATPQVPEVPSLFSEFDDEDLVLTGVPLPLLPAVRTVSSEDDLDRLAPHLPTDAADLLYLLAAGYSLLDALTEAARPEATPPTVDVEDFSVALARPASQMSFKVLANDTELDEILNAPLAQWRIFLHPTQRKLVEMKAKGPARVLGGAGTGKTVVLMHRANHLVRNVFTERDDRILVTTFTRNLALDLKGHLEMLCGALADRIEVVHLHGWAARFMRKQGFGYKIIGSNERQSLMDTAMGDIGEESLPVSFYMEEWDRVVQMQDIETLDDYYTARRVGRGTRIGRRQRKAVWGVMSRYRDLLNEDGKKEWPDLIRDTRQYIENEGLTLPYRAVLADEVQDFTPNDLRLLRVMVPAGPNDLFLVGDGHQRIYGSPVRLGACGIDIRGRRSRRLKVNYRTTEQIRTLAVALLEGLTIDDLDGGIDSLKGYYSLRQGLQPEIEHFAQAMEEAEFIRDTVSKWLEQVEPEEICLAARTKDLIRDRYQAVLEAAGIPSVIVEKEPESAIEPAGVRMATMHRMKGLEFTRVLLAGVNDGTMPLHLPADVLSDDASREDHELQERCLLYVAATRARDELVITGYGEKSPFLVHE